MKRKRLALLLAVALTATSVDSTAMVASAADFTADPVVESEEPEIAEAEEPEVSEETPEAVTEETTEDVDIGFSDGDAEDAGEEVETDTPEIEENTDAEAPELTSEETDVVSDGEKAEAVTINTVTEIGVNETLPVNIENNGDRVWFSFTPQEDGVYSFYSTGDYDTEGYFFESKDYIGEIGGYRWDKEHHDDQSGENNNFKFEKTLTKGNTYYFCAAMFNWASTGNFEVTLTKAKSVVPDETQKIEIDEMHHVTIENGGDCAWFSFTPEKDGEYIFASVNNLYETEGYFFESKEKYVGNLSSYKGTEHYAMGEAEEGFKFKIQKELEAGKTYYYCAGLCDREATGSFDVTLTTPTEEKSVVPDEVQKIGVDEIHAVNIANGGDCAWFSFTPSKDGIYCFTSINSYRHGTEAYFFDSKEYKGRLDSYSWTDHYAYASDGETFYMQRELEAGKTYYYCAKICNESETGSFNVTLSELKSVVADEVYDIVVGDIRTVNIENGGDCAWFSFTPSEDGKYSFYSTGDYDTVGYFFDSKEYTGNLYDYKYGEYYNDDGGENSNFKLAKVLEAGKTYYYCAKFYDESATGSFDVELVSNKTLQRIQATLKNNKIVAGISGELSADVQYTFTDDTVETATLKFGNWDSDATEANVSSTDVRITKKDDPDGYTYSQWEALPAGNYKVTFSLDGVTSDELAFQAVDIEAAPAFYGELKEGDNPDTKTPENEYAYYKFVPSVTGEYNFWNCNGITKYVKNENGSLDSIGGNVLTAGTTYYIQLWGTVWIEGEGEAEYCNLNIQRRPSITGITFTPARTEIYDSNAVRYDDRRIRGKIELTYDNGNTWEDNDTDCTSGLYDNYNNYIKTIIKREDGSVVEDTESLEAGTYRVYMMYGDEDAAVTSDTFTLTVKAFNINDCPNLAEGTSKVTTGIWYIFKPETTGLYSVRCSNRWAPSSVYINDEGEFEDFQLDDGWGSAALEAGRTYLIYFNKDADSKETEFECTITRIADPVRVIVTSRTPSDDTLTFVRGMDQIDIEINEAEVEFEDGTKATVSAYLEDQYGRYLSSRLMKKEADGNYRELEWDEEVTEGEYVYRVGFGKGDNDRVYADDILVRVVSPADAEKTDLNTGKQDIQNENGKFILKFCPEEAGRYEISFNAPISNARVFKAEDNSRISAENKDYAVYATLEKDTDYYIQVQADKKYKDLQMTTSLLTRPQSLKSKARKTTYMAGVEDFDADTIETELTYPDNTVRKVKNQEETNGYYLQYKATKDGRVVYNGSSLTSGTWKVEPYLSASVATGSAVALDIIDAEGTEITAKKPDLSQYSVIEENTETTVSASGRTIYRFCAEKDGTYVLDREEGRSWGTVWFYRDGEAALNCTYESIELKAGETCAVIVTRTAGESETKFKIVKQVEEDPDAGETPITAKTLALSTGMNSLVKIDSNGEMDCTFTPEETGYYAIWSEYNKNRNLDPYVLLYDSDGDYIARDDDGYTAWNFMLVYKLEAGKTYHYKVNMRSESASFYLRFDKFETKEIQKIEIQAKEGKNADDFSVLDGFWEYFDMKISYADGTEKLLDWNSDRDSYENYISTAVSRDGEVTDKELTCKVEFSVLNGLSGKDDYEKVSEVIVKRKGLSGIAQITEGTAQILPVVSEDYFHWRRFAFQVPADGEYIVHIDGAMEETATTDIYAYRSSWPSEGLTLRNVSRNYEADGTYSFQLKKGEWYVVDADARSSENQQPTVSIHKAKEIKSLELVKAPEQTTILPNDVNAVSLKGMKVKVTYTDGTEEPVAYGQTDSDGRYLLHNGVNWINAEKCRVYVRLGGYQISFDAAAGSWDDVKELELNKETKLTAVKGDMITLKLNAATDDIYVFDTDGCYVNDVTEAETGKVTEVSGDQIELQKDTLYYVHVHAFRENPTIKAKQGVCVWEETSRKEATCTEDGTITETCSLHGETRTETTAAKLGHDAGDWQITKNATCTADGEKAKICKRCKAKVETQPIKKLGHNLGSRQTVKAATCGADGESARICTRCKNKFEKQTIKATGKHKYGSWKTTKAATALATGSRERTCTVCKKKERQTIAKLKATLTLSVAAKKTLPLKLKGSYKVNVQMTKGDSVVSWKSSNSRAVSVDKYGKVTAKQAGKTARITVKLRSGLSTWFNVSVQKNNVATTSLKLKNASTGKYMPGSVTLKRNQKLKVTPVIAPVTSNDRVTYTTSNKRVVIVDSKGQITAKGKGTAYITAKSGKKSVKIKITVR